MTKNILKTFLILLLASPAAGFAAPGVPDFSQWASGVTVYAFTEGFPEYLRLSVDSESGVVEAVGKIRSPGFKPWTNQLRLAGFAETDFGPVLVVNCGYPLILGGNEGRLISPDKIAADSFTGKVKNKTIGTVFSDGESVMFHIYRDTMFNPAAADHAEEPSPVVISFGVNQDDTFRIDAPEYSFSVENPGWEPVELIHKEAEDLVAWKYTDDRKTRFRYIVHDSNGNSIDEINESYFRDEYNMTEAEAGPFAVRGFVRAVREGVIDSELTDAGDIYIRLTTAEADRPSPRYYYSAATQNQPLLGGGMRVPVEFQACINKDICYVLYDDEIIICGANIQSRKLPSLPEDFEYSVLFVADRDLIVGWEEKRFPFTGRTGMMHIKMRDILN